MATLTSGTNTLLPPLATTMVLQVLAAENTHRSGPDLSPLWFPSWFKQLIYECETIPLPNFGCTFFLLRRK